MCSLLVWTCRVALQAADTCPHTCVISNQVFQKGLKVIPIKTEVKSEEEEVDVGITAGVEIAVAEIFPASTLGKITNLSSEIF